MTTTLEPPPKRSTRSKQPRRGKGYRSDESAAIQERLQQLATEHGLEVRSAPARVPDRVEEPPIVADDWAQREQKRQENKALRDEKRAEVPEFIPEAVAIRREEAKQKNCKAFREHPRKYVKDIQKDFEDRRTKIEEGISESSILVAGPSDNDRQGKLQKIIDDMVDASGMLDIRPQLAVHTTLSNYIFGNALNASIGVPKFIETNKRTRDFGIDHPEHFKAIIAHEIAHLVRNDFGIKQIIRSDITRRNQSVEVLTDRLAAIIFGHPRRYAELMEEIKLYIAEDRGKDPHEYTQKYLSPKGNARMMKKWAQMLEDAGALDSEGYVLTEQVRKGQMDKDGIILIDRIREGVEARGGHLPEHREHFRIPRRALEVYNRSRDFTEGLLTESKRFGLEHPRPFTECSEPDNSTPER